MSPELISALNVVVGYIVLMGALVWLMQSRNVAYFSVIASFGAYIGAVGSYRIDAIGELDFLGGSLYVPFTLLLMSMTAEKFTIAKARLILSAIMIGLAFVIFATSRWVLFEHMSVGHVAVPDAATARLEWSFSALIMVYFSGVFIIAFQKWRDVHSATRIALPAALALFLVTVANFVLSYDDHHIYYLTTPDAWMLVVNTFLLRFAVIFTFWSYLRYALRETNADNPTPSSA